MHSISNGLIKLMFTYWFEKPGSNSYSLSSSMELIDERIKSLKVPSFVCNKISSQAPEDAVFSDSGEEKIDESFQWKKRKIMDEAKINSKQTSQEIMNVRFIDPEFCLIQHTASKKMEIVKAKNVNLGNNVTIKTGTGFFFKENNILRPVKILIIGLRKDCDEQLKFLCNYEKKPDNTPKNQTKKRVLSTNEIEKIQKNSNQSLSDETKDLKDKIEELENALVEKDLHIKNLEKSLKREQEINETLRNNYGNLLN
ncbi:unnamed protein product [Brachionus calyciflorus]|uniref:Uncharacterized protein n=1 Tax=Brachionus calyciflorus TaxID=104777 RepID=A0A813ZQL0_9BILA|nr:unnamed protein product [Brachionus calyciflorus]